MKYLHKSWRVFCYRFCRINTTPRIPLLFILVGIYVYSTAQPVADFSNAVRIAATPWLFPHLTNDYICQMIFMAGVIFLFCDAPFTDESYRYILSRSGRGPWALGHVLYIIILSFIYVLFLMGLSILPLAGNLQWSSQWGKVIGTLALTDAARQFPLTFSLSSYLIGAYTPHRAMLLSFILEWACAVWLGLVIYFFNTVAHKMVGTFLSAAFILLDLVIANEWTPAAYAFSPITLAQLSSLAGGNRRFGITLGYATKFYVITLAVLILLCVFSNYFKKTVCRLKNNLSGQGRKRERRNPNG